MSYSKYRSNTGVLFTRGLFFETTYADKSSVVYSLKDWDHVVDDTTYPSLYLLYLQENDPTEYRFATAHLDGLYHWEALSACTWFQVYLSRWRRELEVRMKSQALLRIMSEAKSSSKEAFQANRYLLEKAWEPKEPGKHGRGRPSTDEIRKAATEIASTDKRILEDFSRISFQKLS